MQITLNGKPKDLSESCTIARLLKALELGQRRIAVEVNHCIVPRSEHETTVLCDGDRVEIVHAIGGG